MNNPFNITFGKEPITSISRENELEEIYNSFESEDPDSDIYIITGVRGSGKTVALQTASNHFKTYKNWIVIEFNPEKEMLNQLASKIIDEGNIKHLFVEKEFSFSFKGLGINLKGNTEITDISAYLNKEFEYLKKKNIRVLITIDDASSTHLMSEFIHEFQLLIREKFYVSLLMTGLYNNIMNLQNKKNLTFLCRAPKIILRPLNKKTIANNYKKILETDENNSINLSKFTNGYAYAYQLIGNMMFKTNKKKLDNVLLQEFDELIQQNVYSFIYEELTEKEKEIVKAATKNPSNEYLINNIPIKKNMLSAYKKTLFSKGIITEDYRTSIKFNLPRFKEFTEFQEKMEE